MDALTLADELADELAVWIVMEQAQVDSEAAKRAIGDNEFDIVRAILALTM